MCDPTVSNQLLNIECAGEKAQEEPQMANNEMNGSVEENREDQRENQREDAIVKAEDVVAEEAPVAGEKAAEEKTEKVEKTAEVEKKAEKNKHDNDDDTVGFDELELPDDIVNAVRKVGFDSFPNSGCNYPDSDERPRRRRPGSDWYW